MQIPQSYTLRARVAPLVLAVGPLLVLALGFIPTVPWPSDLWLLVGGSSFILLGQLGRDLGRRSEPGLFDRWGGPPTTARLRFRGNANPAGVDRLHGLLRSLPQRLTIPDRDEELANPVAADAAYAAAVALLRELTRDRSRFPLVFDENINYGFRRNLWALKRIGIGSCILALVVCIAAGVPLGLLVMRQGALAFVAPGVCATVGLWLWSRADDDWVRVAAEAYADRLLASTEVLAVGSQPGDGA